MLPWLLIQRAHNATVQHFVCLLLLLLFLCNIIFNRVGSVDSVVGGFSLGKILLHKTQ